MIRPVLNLSRAGLLVSGLFLGLAAAVFAWVIYSATTNPADSGESGILLLPFATPWVMIMPQGWVGPLTGIGAIFLNAMILYLLFGGLRFKITEPVENRSCPHCKNYPLRKVFPPQTRFAPYNICQDCGEKFTVNYDTKKRQIVALVLSPFLLGTTIMAYLYEGGWIWAMLVSNLVFWCYFIYANAKVVFVPYQK